MGRRHMVREGGECSFRKSYIIAITILARSLSTLSPCVRPQTLISITMAFIIVLMDLHHPTGTQRKP
jgi:hypothetical protein